MNRATMLRSILLMLCSCFASALVAQPVMIDHLRIELDTKKGRKPSKNKAEQKKYDKSWKKTCDQLGKGLMINKGPWGFGAFSSYSCYNGSKRTGGQDKTSPWSLIVTDGLKGASFRLVRDKSEVAKIDLPPSDFTLRFFEDDEFVDLLALTLADSMPNGMAVTKAMIKGSPPQFSARYFRKGKSKKFKYDLPPPPAALTLYRLNWDPVGKGWQSEVVGEAKKVKEVPPAEKGKKKSKPGEVIYETTPEVDEALSAGPLWAQSSDGPGQRQQELQGTLRDAQTRMDAAGESGQFAEFLKGNVGNLVDNLLSTAASGYVGLRYGLQVLPAEGELGKILGKTSVFSLLAEVRGGPIAGLRYYYDKLPEEKAVLDGANGEKFAASIAFSRHVLGYSFDFNPHFLVDRVTAAPKLGIWTFDAVLPVEQDETGKVVQTAPFRLGTTASLALEVGLELLSDWYTLRGWYAIDSGFSLLKTGGKVTSNRLGIDTYFTAGPVIPIFGHPFRTALVGFYVYEAVSLEAGVPKDLAPGEEAISGIEYSSGYAGGGVAISW